MFTKVIQLQPFLSFSDKGKIVYANLFQSSFFLNKRMIVSVSSCHVKLKPFPILP